MPTPRLASSFADTAHSTGLLLWQVTNRWQATQRAVLKPYGLTHVQFVLLASLAWLDGGHPVTQQDLAGQAATDPMMTSQVLRALEQRGLLRRDPHPTDRRARMLTITPAGRELANRAVVAVETCDARFFSTLGDDLNGFTACLHMLAREARETPTR